MREIISTLTSKGQVTIPAEVRRHLGIGQGDKLSFVIEDNGNVELHVPRYPDVESLRGQTAALRDDLTYRDMKAIANEDRFADKLEKG